MNKKISPIVAYLADTGHLVGCQSLLSWDQETMMPRSAINARASQLAGLAKIVHQRRLSDKFRSLLDQVVDLESGRCVDDTLTVQERRLVQEIYRDWKQVVCLPDPFVASLTRLKAESQHAWETAKQTKDFSLFLPYLKRIVDMTRQKIDYLEWEGHPYDAVIDEYEPGMRISNLNPIFENLKKSLLPLIDTFSTPDDPICRDMTFDKRAQWDFGMEILKKMGFDFDRGRQDCSSHPFTIQSHPSDVRVTTRFLPNDLMEGLSSTIHEGGHALYEQGLDPEWFGTPFGEAISMGMHESQSRLWENLVGKRRSFWEGQYPRLQQLFPQLKPISLDRFYRHIHRVQKGPIRVAADECTYNLHILIRYELERDLFSAALSVSDLRSAWNDKYRQYLNISPSNDAEGILQDVHWSFGAFGYFPSYTLGNLYASQIFDAINKIFPDLDDDFRRGDFNRLREWLKINIHQIGRKKTASELMESLTGTTLSEKPFLRYLKNKYTTIYSHSIVDGGFEEIS